MLSYALAYVISVTVQFINLLIICKVFRGPRSVEVSDRAYFKITSFNRTLGLQALDTDFRSSSYYTVNTYGETIERLVL